MQGGGLFLFFVLLLSVVAAGISSAAGDDLAEEHSAVSRFGQTINCFCLENPLYIATLTFNITAIDCDPFLVSLASLTQTDLANWCLVRITTGTRANELLFGILDASNYTAEAAATSIELLTPDQLATINVIDVSVEKVPDASSLQRASLILLISFICIFFIAN
jgi:hypothetical protein